MTLLTSAMGNGQSAEGEGEPPGAGAGAGPLPDAEAAAAALASIGGGVAALEGCLVRPAAARWAAEEAWRRAAGERLRQAEAAAERRWHAVEERLRCVADESWRRVALAEERARDANDAVARLQERVEELEETVRRLAGGGGAEKDEASLERAAAITNGQAASDEEPSASGDAMQDFERSRLLAYGGGLLLPDHAPKALNGGLYADIPPPADLEERMQALEASLAKALGVLFPRVDALLYKLERRRGLQLEPEEKDAAIAPSPSPSSPSPPPAAPPRPTRLRPQPTPQALLEAAREGSAREVRRLLEAAANPNAADADGRTALHWAAIYGRADSLQELLRCGGNANCRSHRSVRGFTPLHEASLRGHPACVALLVDGGGADVEARDDTGWTPLHLAATRGHEATVQALLARGASPLARNIWGKRPADVTRSAPLRRLLHHHHHQPPPRPQPAQPLQPLQPLQLQLVRR